MRFPAWRYKVFKRVESVFNHGSSIETKGLAWGDFMDIYRLESDYTPDVYPLQRQA